MGNLIQFFYNKATYFIGFVLSCLATYYSHILILKWDYDSIGGVSEHFQILTAEGFARDFGIGLPITLFSATALFILALSTFGAFEDFHIAIRAVLSITCLAVGVYQFTQLLTFLSTTFMIALIAVGLFALASVFFGSSSSR